MITQLLLLSHLPKETQVNKKVIWIKQTSKHWWICMWYTLKHQTFHGCWSNEHYELQISLFLCFRLSTCLLPSWDLGIFFVSPLAWSYGLTSQLIVSRFTCAKTVVPVWAFRRIYWCTDIGSLLFCHQKTPLFEARIRKIGASKLVAGQNSLDSC